MKRAEVRDFVAKFEIGRKSMLLHNAVADSFCFAIEFCNTEIEEITDLPIDCLNAG